MKVYDHSQYKRPKRRAQPRRYAPTRPPMPLGLLAFLNILGMCIVGMGIYTYLQGRDNPQNVTTTAPISIAQSAALYGQITDGGSSDTLITIIDVLPKASVAVQQRETQEECFAIQHALWQHYPDQQMIQVTTETPVQGGVTMVGVCTLKSTSLYVFEWDKLDAQRAWRLYDSAYFA